MLIFFLQYIKWSFTPEGNRNNKFVFDKKSLKQAALFNVQAFQYSIGHEPKILIGMSFKILSVFSKEFFSCSLHNIIEYPPSIISFILKRFIAKNNKLVLINCNDIYIIAATPPPPPPPPSGGGCFPSTARATLENGKSVTMSELETGDKVQTGRNISFSLLIQIC